MTNLSQVDLNLMTVFEALFQEHHVSRAAARIGRSQPAVSNALGRLRDLFGDPLFVRTPKGMIPTPRAIEIRPMLEAAMEHLRSAIDDDHFDPATSRRHFVVASADGGASYFLPRILPTLRELAPNMTIAVMEAWSTEAVDALARGKADFAIGVFSQLEDFASLPLASMREVCLGDIDNPALQTGPISMDAYLDLPKIVLKRLDTGNVVNAALAIAGHRTNAVVTLPQFFGAARAVQGTDLVVILPETLIDDLPDRHRYAVVPLGFEVPPILITLIWNPRYDADAAHVWFRQMIQRSLSQADPFAPSN